MNSYVNFDGGEGNGYRASCSSKTCTILELLSFDSLKFAAVALIMQ